MVVYAAFGDVWDDGYGINVHCFGIFTMPEKANELLESLAKDETIRYGFVQEFVCDKETDEQIALYIE